jgi:hypothetical protein
MRRIPRNAARIALALLSIAAGAGAALAHPPYGLVVDGEGNAYFSDLEAVWRVAPDGRMSLFRPGEDGVHVHELVLAADGAVEGDVNRYDPSTQIYRTAIWRRSPDGRETWALAPTPTPPKGLGLWQDRAGNRYLSQWPANGDRRTMLFRRSPEGRVTLLYGPREEAAKFREVIVSSVGAMTFPADGSVVFADTRALRRVAPDGAVTTLYQGPPDAVLRGLSAVSGGRILAADFGRRQVLAFSAQAQPVTLYTSPKGWLPTAAAMAGARLLVLEANANPYDYVNRVRLVEVKSGAGRVVAAPGDPSAVPRRGAAAAPGRDGAASYGEMAAATIAAAAALGFALRWLRDRRKARG